MSKIISNSIMKKQLEKIADTPGGEIPKLPDFILKDFIEWDGCILIGAGNESINMNTHFTPNEHFNDRTELEAFYNHVHVNDYFPEVEACPGNSLKLALKMVEMWEEKLKARFPQIQFHLIVSCDEFGAIMRFYKCRIEEGSWINIDNIEGYTENGVLLKEIG
ncbi:hypothetical protein [Sporomusa sp.]|uniref:hypothetical protein n=1 Tax=Sporomusa sp. TaxID=2078658 RepID=UPI002BD6C3A0|nr:hypothetical protein [Sporomusa sp.]HWR06299.1 hypothetical protein [Sporomusa sp.]